MAGEGMPLYLWAGMAGEGDGDDGWEVGRQRAARTSGSFSFRNAVVREQSGRIAATLIGYALDDSPALTNYAAMPPMFVPLQQLEDLAPGTWYINALATYPEFRSLGFGSELLGIAQELARAAGKRGLSLIVSDGNAGAIRLYERSGFGEVETRPMVKEQWANPGRNWVLMTRSL